MQVSNEIFVMISFLAGLPIIGILLQKADLPGKLFFFFAYLSFLLSNIFTVTEAFYLYSTMNFLEHFMMLCGAIFTLLGIIRITKGSGA